MSGGEGAAANRLCEFVKSMGIEFKRIGSNVILRNKGFDPDRKSVVLNSHLDTVKPNDSWTTSPFTAIIENDKITGLGANDAGGALVSLLAAFIEFQNEDIPLNLVYVASAEEENSGDNGIRKVLPEIQLDIDLAVIGEPTEMHAAVAEKGLLVIDATVIGESGHAARPHGNNAIDIAIADIQRLNQFHFERASPVLGPVIKSVTQIYAGTQHNVIPDKCTFVIDVRVNEFYSLPEVFKELQNICNAKLVARSFKNNPSRLKEEHLFHQALHTLNIETFGSPTLSDQAHFSCPSVKIGPGKSERSHTANEFIYQSEISIAIEIYIDLLREYFKLKSSE